MRSRERERKQAASDEYSSEEFRSRYAEKERAIRASRRGAASDFGITYRDKRSFYGVKRSKNLGGAK